MLVLQVNMPSKYPPMGIFFGFYRDYVCSINVAVVVFPQKIILETVFRLFIKVEAGLKNYNAKFLGNKSDFIASKIPNT